MSMCNSACHADTVTNEFVTKTCPDEMAELLKVLAENDYDMDRLGACANNGGDIEGELTVDMDFDPAEKIMKAYEILCMTFTDKTNLDLDIRYNEKDDRGDEVDGMFWEVDGVYELTTAGKKYKDEIERKFWTVFG